ncbi:hypothetical protein Wcon_01380 [Wolbachia endosymbiont of Cylisticus convexus]|uniref:hypothetical protein n=1 Tax=Wolbachia endosymbiont of Cylisticus convexus TaxID=118728 RepID=UPI000DF6DD7E|nr:hypothetical protein [Wolbachia endosymbiont of Cylisticus convexus]RDD34534.1 hypothetical protein Wcon_01380 [Wolbachia endosymbiont of Cylisticus convexus]
MNSIVFLYKFIYYTAAKQQIAGYTKEKVIHSEELLEIVREQLNKDDMRILTDTKLRCNIIPVDIHAKHNQKK